MKYSRDHLVILIVAFSTIAASQTQPPADPYKPVLDRLQAITTIPLKHWKPVNADMPHGETPDDSMAGATGDSTVSFSPPKDWSKENLPLPTWLYTSVEIPAAINGFPVAGSRVSLNLVVGSNTGIMISVFVNHNMVSRDDGDSQVPIMLTQSAVPGHKLLIAVRILSSGSVGCCGGPPETHLTAASLNFNY